MISAIHHVQIAIPVGGEHLARAFFVDTLGFAEIEKPEHLRARGGCWFTSGSAEVHIGVEEGFTPARKAHPAFVTADLDQTRRKITDAGYEVADDTQLGGYRRFYAADAFGNRIEFMQPIED